jgi:hypothetical protein
VNSFFTRINKYRNNDRNNDINNDRRIHYNNIISAPFFKICIDEKSFFKEIALNFTANYLNFLKINDFKKIILYDEYSLPSWTLIAATKNLKNHTVFAIQHANIPSNHKEYIEFIKTGDKFLPDHIITFCDEEKVNLTNIIKKEKKRNNTKITALGCSRFDSLKKKYDKNTLRNKYGTIGKKIIMWMTQTHSLDQKENEQNCKDVFETFKKLDKKEFELIIKLHPGETQKNTIYDKYNKKYRNLVRIFRGNENAYDLIRISDAVLLKDSSTFMIASLLNKEIGILNLIENRPYYKEYNFPVIIRNSTGLGSFLKSVGTSKNKMIFDNFNKKISGKYFNNFGNATKKIVEFIKKN